MIQITNKRLPQAIRQVLIRLNQPITSKLIFEEQVVEAKRQWDSKNNTVEGKTVFTQIRDLLKKMSACEEHCVYCEAGIADEIEHIFPKRLYPQKTFLWENYLYACGICNGTYKNDKFAIFDNHTFIDISPKRSNYIEPQNEDAVFISPRAENPMDSIILDFETFFFVPFAQKNSKEYQRAYYTINTVLSLNRPVLVKARRNAFAHYQNYLIAYRNANRGAEKRKYKKEILTASHPTVWEEMKRQQIWTPSISNLFVGIVEVLAW
jgi:5-methylcytosine-specific restriction endonuclease McrA